DSVDAAPVGIIGPQLQSHPSFPEGVNVGFVEFRDAANIRLRVFERGVGETAACGTGAAAAAAVGRLWGELGETVRVEVTGGVLNTAWPGPGHAIWLSGPAVRVYEGRIEV
ncbi:MAG: diaminopimelate epimerase, partial [Rhodospirillaceae bacterium]|nr:diaminopimelate epimerase [Rhodospirillaceae bacterium]